MYLLKGGSYSPVSRLEEVGGDKKKKKRVKEFVFDVITGFLGNTEINFFKVEVQKPK